MRMILAATTSLIAISAANAETVTTYTAAPGQEFLALGEYKPSFPGATVLNLDVGIGSALFRDPAGAENTYYTVSDRGPNFTCGDLEDLMPVKKDDACPEVEGMKAGDGRIYPVPGYNVSIYQVTLDPAAKTFTVTNAWPLKTPGGKPIVGLTNPLTIAKTDKPRDGEGKAIAQDINAIDAEGLVRLADGRFFIGEENATGIAEVSPEGVVVRRFVPAGTEGDFASPIIRCRAVSRRFSRSARQTAGSSRSQCRMTENSSTRWCRTRSPILTARPTATPSTRGS